jgi:hypothetical protein
MGERNRRLDELVKPHRKKTIEQILEKVDPDWPGTLGAQAIKKSLHRLAQADPKVKATDPERVKPIATEGAQRTNRAIHDKKRGKAIHDEKKI